MSQCTGQCCHDIVLIGSYGYPHTKLTIRGLKDAARSVEAAKIWVLLRYTGKVDRWGQERDEHRCVALTPTGCCLPRDQRPNMCNTYPVSLCGYCGARSESEARGTALQTTK